MTARNSESRGVAKLTQDQRTGRFRQWVKVASLPLLLLIFAAVARGQSALDGFDPGANGPIHAVVVQPDGKILIGGAFSSLAPNGGPTVTRNHIARLNPDGTLDAGFDPNASHGVFALALQADGKILAGGNFFEIGGQFRFSFARLDPVTGLADSFDPHVGAILVHAIAVQADGKILVGGEMTSSGGEKRNGIARIDPVTGQTDSFNPNADGMVLSIVVQPDGKILTGGTFDTIGGQTRNALARLDPTTGSADSFNPNARNNCCTGSVKAIAVQADGKILAGGNFTTIGGQARNNIARLDGITGLADSFDPNASFFVETIALQTDGKVLVGGYFHGANSIGGQTRNYIARLDPVSGQADSFDPNAEDIVESIAVQADGKILVGGGFTALAPNGGAAVARNNIARLETDGRLDQTLNPSTDGDTIIATAVQPDGKILIGGDFHTILGVERNGIARLNADGTLDTAFNPNANHLVESIALQADGKILVGGPFTTIGGQARSCIARLDATTGLADSFNPNANIEVFSIAVQADGKILAGGGFTSIGGQTRIRMARLDPTTGLADSFDPSANHIVSSIAVQADGNILAGGQFTSIGGQPRNRIARLNGTTGAADSFDPNANDRVVSIVVQPDGKILVSGAFFGANSIGGQTRNRLARLDPATGLADSFNPNANAIVNPLALQGDGKILVGGSFTRVGGQTRNGLARLDATSGLADSFDPNADNSSVFTIALQGDGKIVVGGLFGQIGGQPRLGYARLSNDTAALQGLAVTKTSVTWTRAGSSPQFGRTTFEYSTDSVNYISLGSGVGTGSIWTLTGLNLPTGQNIYIRARGHYRSGYSNASESSAETVRNAYLAGPPTLGNISTRLRVETGDNVLIGGFIITGTQPKRIIVRAIGPSLPLAGALADPVLELRNAAGALILSNNDWRDDQESEIIATGISPSSDLESAIVATLPANGSAYTAIVRGLDNGTGIGVVEAYDLDQTVNSKLANISTRGFVQTGDDVLIGGLIVLGQDTLRVIVRAIGPSLPVAGALENPALSLYDGNGTLLVSNDNWRTGGQESEIIATGIPPSNDLESAIVRNLSFGNYTAIVRGVNNTTGIAVVEAYGLN
ncbi:MAG TPA: delta-60 repeat domain-containing protein [Chthoniobacterales bacterium]|nr:delta-60 repeat domain-containing protein [Chthoniobacterales bacterium]